MGRLNLSVGWTQDQGNHAQSKARSDAKLAELSGSDIFGGAQQVGHKAAASCGALDCALRASLLSTAVTCICSACGLSHIWPHVRLPPGAPTGSARHKLLAEPSHSWGNSGKTNACGCLCGWAPWFLSATCA